MNKLVFPFRPAAFVSGGLALLAMLPMSNALAAAEAFEAEYGEDGR